MDELSKVLAYEDLREDLKEDSKENAMEKIGSDDEVKSQEYEMINKKTEQDSKLGEPVVKMSTSLGRNSSAGVPKSDRNAKALSKDNIFSARQLDEDNPNDDSEVKESSLDQSIRCL